MAQNLSSRNNKVDKSLQDDQFLRSFNFQTLPANKGSTGAMRYSQSNIKSYQYEADDNEGKSLARVQSKPKREHHDKVYKEFKIQQENSEILKRFEIIQSGDRLSVERHRVQPMNRKSLHHVFNRKAANHIDNENDRMLRNLKQVKGLVPTVLECRRNYQSQNRYMQFSRKVNEGKNVRKSMDEVVILPKLVQAAPYQKEDKQDTIKAGEVTIGGTNIILDSQEDDSLCEIPSNFEDGKEEDKVSTTTPDYITFTDQKTNSIKERTKNLNMTVAYKSGAIRPMVGSKTHRNSQSSFSKEKKFVSKKQQEQDYKEAINVSQEKLRKSINAFRRNPGGYKSHRDSINVIGTPDFVTKRSMITVRISQELERQKAEETNWQQNARSDFISNLKSVKSIEKIHSNFQKSPKHRRPRYANQF